MLQSGGECQLRGLPPGDGRDGRGADGEDDRGDQAGHPHRQRGRDVDPGVRAQDINIPDRQGVHGVTNMIVILITGHYLASSCLSYYLPHSSWQFPLIH